MEVEIKIDPTCKTPKIIIAAENITDEVKALAEKLSAEGLRSISGFKDNTARLLEPEEIVRIYSCGGKIVAVTDSGEFFLRRRLYELEELLEGKKFVRISNSELVNLKRVKEFDLSAAGTICVFLSNSDVTYVSRRYVVKIKKILGI